MVRTIPGNKLGAWLPPDHCKQTADKMHPTSLAGPGFALAPRPAGEVEDVALAAERPESAAAAPATEQPLRLRQRGPEGVRIVFAGPCLK